MVRCISHWALRCKLWVADCIILDLYFICRQIKYKSRIIQSATLNRYAGCVTNTWRGQIKSGERMHPEHQKNHITLMKGLRRLVSRFVAEFGRHRRQLSGGSESGTGSNGKEEDVNFLSGLLAPAKSSHLSMQEYLIIIMADAWQRQRQLFQ